VSTIPPPRTSAALVSDRTFGPYFVGNLSSNVGTWFQQVTAAVVMFDVTGSTFMVGMVGVSQFLPALVLAPWTGAAADRFDRKRLLVRAQTVAAVATGLLAVVTLTLGLDRFPVAWPLLATAFVVGLVNAVSVPAQQALVPALVPTQDLDQAVALNSVTFNLARAVGPALGTVVLVAWGAGSAFAVRPRPITRPKRASIWAAFPLLRADPTLVVLLVGVMALGFGSDPVLTLTPALASKLSAPATDTAGLVGILISAFGAGAVAGTLLVARLRVRWGQVRVSIGGLVLLAVGMVGLALATSTWLAVAALVLGGAGFLFGVTGLTTAIHLRIQEEFRGRIMALWGVAFLGSRPVAAFIDGVVADLISPKAATLLMVLVVVACASLVQVKLGGGRAED
jgi:MFS family permease